MSDSIVIKEEINLEEEIRKVCAYALVMDIPVLRIVAQVYTEYDRLLMEYTKNARFV